MPAIPTYNERSGLEFKVEFFDTAHVPAVPGSVFWRLDCETTGRVLQDWVEVTGIASVSVDIDVPGGLNAIQQNANPRELKSFLVVANKDTDREFSKEYPYYVKNLRGRA